MISSRPRRNFTQTSGDILYSEQKIYGVALKILKVDFKVREKIVLLSYRWLRLSKGTGRLTSIKQFTEVTVSAFDRMVMINTRPAFYRRCA